jgi:hypothetical protein
MSFLRATRSTPLISRRWKEIPSLGKVISGKRGGVLHQLLAVHDALRALQDFYTNHRVRGSELVTSGAPPKVFPTGSGALLYDTHGLDELVDDHEFLLRRVTTTCERLTADSLALSTDIRGHAATRPLIYPAERVRVTELLGKITDALAQVTQLETEFRQGFLLLTDALVAHHPRFALKASAERRRLRNDYGKRIPLKALTDVAYQFEHSRKRVARFLGRPYTPGA